MALKHSITDDYNPISLQSKRTVLGSTTLLSTSDANIQIIKSGLASTAADTEVGIAHALDRNDLMIVQLCDGDGGVVYVGDTVTTRTTFYVKSTTANNPVTLLVM